MEYFGYYVLPLLEHKAQILEVTVLSVKLAVKLAQSVWHSLLVHELASLSPVRSNGLVKIECA